MPVSLACSGCGSKLRAPDDAVGRKLKCPRCATVLIVTVGATQSSLLATQQDTASITQPPNVEESASSQSTAQHEKRECPFCSELIMASARKCRHCGEILDPELKESRKLATTKSSIATHEEADVRPAPDDAGEWPPDNPSGIQKPKADTAGIIALIFGIIAVICLILGCFIPLVPYIIATVLALAGLALSFAAKGGYKVAGFTLNGLTLAPSVFLLFCCGFGLASLVGLGSLVPTQKTTKATASAPVPRPEGPKKEEKATDASPAVGPGQDTGPARQSSLGQETGRASSSTDRDPEGTLVLTFSGADVNRLRSTWLSSPKKLELFIDGQLFRTLASHQLRNELKYPLPPGLHTVAIKYNGFDVYSRATRVKETSAGQTFLDVTLVLRGTVRIKNTIPMAAGVRVSVDNGSNNQFANESQGWPALSDTIVFTAEPGQRVIEVYAVSRSRVATFTAQVKPGEETLIKTNIR